MSQSAHPLLSCDECDLPLIEEDDRRHHLKEEHDKQPLARNSGGLATIEELPIEPITKANDSPEHPKASKKGRLGLKQRCPDMEKVIQYNMLAKNENMINKWKSYPGLAPIITMAREILDNGKTMQIEKLTKLMQSHEIQQSAPLIATIEKVYSNNLSNSKECSRAIGDMILWDTPVVTSRDTWPSRYQEIGTTPIQPAGTDASAKHSTSNLKGGIEEDERYSGATNKKDDSPETRIIGKQACETYERTFKESKTLRVTWTMNN